MNGCIKRTGYSDQGGFPFIPTRDARCVWNRKSSTSVGIKWFNRAIRLNGSNYGSKTPDFILTLQTPCRKATLARLWSNGSNHFPVISSFTHKFTKNWFVCPYFSSQKGLYSFLSFTVQRFPLSLKSSSVTDTYYSRRQNADSLSLQRDQEGPQCRGLHVVLVFLLHPEAQALPGRLADPMERTHKKNAMKLSFTYTIIKIMCPHLKMKKKT